jgi:hypothetical protein
MRYVLHVLGPLNAALIVHAAALQETTNAGKSTRKTTAKKQAASAAVTESPLRRTALLDDFNSVKQVRIMLLGFIMSS